MIEFFSFFNFLISVMFIGMIASTTAIIILNMKNKTPEEKRKDSIKGLIFAPIIIISIHLVPQKAEGAAAELLDINRILT